MSILVNLEERLRDAMRAKNVAEREVIKLVKADIMETVTSEKVRRDPTDSDAMQSIRRIISVRKDQVESNTNIASTTTDEEMKQKYLGNAEKATNDITTLMSFLPVQMSADEIRVAAESIISEKKLDKAIKSMGPILKELMARYEGKFENAVASATVKQLLTA